MATLTKQAILHSFQEMLRERPFNKITVRDIVDDCGINRKTFYYYYTDIYALAEDYFTGIVERITDRYPATGTQWIEGMKALLIFFQNNKKIALNMYHSMDLGMIEDVLYNGLIDYSRVYIENKTQGKNISELDKKNISAFITFGITGTILNWVRDGLKGDTSAVIDRYIDICGGSLNYIASRLETLDPPEA